MTFPIINHINDLLPLVQGNKQIRVKQEPNGLTIVCYMVQDEDTFTGVNAEFERECRGITFHADGRIASRTLHKFFNVGQTDEVRPENIDWHRVVRIMDKRDGSMVTPVFTGKSKFDIKFKTKKTFDSAEANAADALATDQLTALWIHDVLTAGLTPTFEFTSPKFPIVLKYAKDELTLLHVRENVSGRYLSEAEMRDLEPPMAIVENIIDEFKVSNIVSWDLMKAAAETREGIEGWVIQFDDGEMVKLKTKWYCDLHHSVTFTRWRDIARSVVADQSDDLKGAFAVTGRSIEPILLVERAIKVKVEMAEAVVRAIVATGHASGNDAKAMAMEYKSHPRFSQIMRVFRGQEVNWMEWYEKNHLDADWGLEVVGDDA
jgi:RNA ligase